MRLPRKTPLQIKAEEIYSGKIKNEKMYEEKMKEKANV